MTASVAKQFREKSSNDDILDKIEADVTFSITWTPGGCGGVEEAQKDGERIDRRRSSKKGTLNDGDKDVHHLTQP